MEKISKLKRNWDGHVARTTENRWTTHITFWKPPAEKKEPRKTKDRWRDDLDSFIKR